MSTPSARFRRVAGRFSERVAEVPAEAWDNPAPCDGWRARDVVAHLIEWVPAVIGRAGIDLPQPTGNDPAAAWLALAAALQHALDDPETAGRRFDVGPPGEMSVEQAIDMLVTGDVLVHTWDLARACGLDETIDEALAADQLAGMAAIDEMLRSSGHFGPKVPVGDDASVTDRLIAFTGRDPAWRA